MQIWWTPRIPLVYVANQKAGCSTIKQSLKSAQAGAYTREGRPFKRVLDPHTDDDCLRRKGLAPHLCRERHVFSCVRNPFARALSAYLDKVEALDHRQYSELRHTPIVNFEAFLPALVDFTPYQMYGHFRPQHINLNYTNIAYDAAFFLEKPAVIAGVVAQIDSNFSLERFAPHARGAKNKLGAYYSATAQQLVRQIYARDFELFGYSRNLEDAHDAPGEMLAAGHLITHGAPLPPLPSPPVQSTNGNRLVMTLHFRRLIEARLI